MPLGLTGAARDVNWARPAQTHIVALPICMPSSNMHATRRKIPALDDPSLVVLDNDLRHKLRLKMFILAESSALEDLNGLQRCALAALSRAIYY